MVERQQSTELRKAAVEARKLMDALFAECIRLKETIGKPVPDNENETNRRSIAQMLAMQSGQLAGQIIAAAAQGCLLLSLIGLRSLYENLFNAKYTFGHPRLKGKLSWQYRICADYFPRGNKHDAPKSHLDDKSLWKRAKCSGLSEFYKADYVGLCNYVHMMIYTAALNDPKTFERLTKDCFSRTLCLLNDITEAVAPAFTFSFNRELEQQVMRFRDAWESGAIERGDKPASPHASA